MTNKKLQLLVSALLALGMNTLAAAEMNLPIGSGSLDSNNNIVRLPLTLITSEPIYYDVNCLVTKPAGNEFPAKLLVEVQFTDLLGSINTHSGQVVFDGVPSETHQHALLDAKTHHINVERIYGRSLSEKAGAKDAVLVLAWLASNDMTRPINYSCSVTPSAGK